MKTPFLSHKRIDADALALLHRELKTRGVGGWRDVESLGLGVPTGRSIRRAIRRETGGFIWFGTAASLGSPVICDVEIPRALRRRRFSRKYPFVPLFVDIKPEDVPIVKSLGARRASQLRDLNGLVKRDGEAIDEFCERAARQYVHDAVCAAMNKRRAIHVQAIGQRGPDPKADFVLDWRDVLSEGRPVRAADVLVLKDAVSSLCRASLECDLNPSIVIEANLRLPLAAMVGWELGAHAQIDLTVVQRDGASRLEVSSMSTSNSELPEPKESEFGRNGPTVVAVSVKKDLSETVVRYADSVNARNCIHLHVGETLGAAQIRGVAEWTARHLAQLNDAGVPKHLLLLGPSALAVWIGHIANGTGKTTIPFWDGKAGYSGLVDIG